MGNSINVESMKVPFSFLQYSKLPFSYEEIQPTHPEATRHDLHGHQISKSQFPKG